MTTSMGALVIITTVPDENLAVKITESLLQQQLAACVHTLPLGRSTYRWKGAIESSTELMLVIKSTTVRYEELEADIRRLHSYEVPEILAFPVEIAFPAYMKWIWDETK